MKSIHLCLAAMASLFLGSEGEASWSKYESAHFVIYSQSPAKEVELLGSRLEKVDALMRLATSLKDDVEPVKVRIYEVEDNEAVERALDTSNTGIAGFYANNGLGPFLVTPKKTDFGQYDFTPELVLHHEYAHHFMLQYFPANYPFWYVEGFAELIGSSTIMPDGRIAYGMPAKHRGHDILADWMPLSELLLKPPEKIVDFDTYGQGWAVTHFLTFTKERALQLRQYLAAIQAGKTSAEAASAFGDLAKLNADARRYVGSGSFAYKPVKVATREPVIEKVTPISAAEAALIPETIAYSDDDLSSYRKPAVRERQRAFRETTLAHIRAKEAQYPADPFALRLLAEAEAAGGHDAQSAAAAERLLALSPNDVVGLSRKSLELSMQAGRLTGSTKIALVEKARRLAVQANRIDGTAELPVVAYYQSYHLTGQDAPESAINALADVLSLRPSDDRTRNLLVDALAERGRYAEAIAEIMPIANSTHDSPQRTAAREKMSKLQALLGKVPATTRVRS